MTEWMPFPIPTPEDELWEVSCTFVDGNGELVEGSYKLNGRPEFPYRPNLPTQPRTAPKGE